VNTQKLIGSILLGCFILWTLGSGVLFFSGYATGELELGAAVLGLLVAALIGAPGGIAGVYLLVRGSGEQRELEQLRIEQDVLGRVRTRGEVGLDELAHGMGVAPAVVEAAVYSLVGKNLFSGYVDWQSRRLISRDASAMPLDRCPRCDGELAVAGKGIIRCEHCGSEIFITEGQTPGAQ